MKSSEILLEELRTKMDGFVGQTFTENMRQQIRLDTAEIRYVAHDEGQAMMAKRACANANTSFCVQCEQELAIEEYDFEVCRRCNADGGFSI